MNLTQYNEKCYVYFNRDEQEKLVELIESGYGFCD